MKSCKKNIEQTYKMVEHKDCQIDGYQSCQRIIRLKKRPDFSDPIHLSVYDRGQRYKKYGVDGHMSDTFVIFSKYMTKV